jgi:hypothetical protein
VVGAEARDIGAVGQRREAAHRGNGLPVAEVELRKALGHGQEVHGRVREDPGGDGVHRAAVDLGRGAELGHPAFPERGGVAAQQKRLLGLGGGVDEDGARFLEDAGDLGAQLLAQLVVEVRQGLVEKDEARVLHERAGQGAALLLAARQLQGPALEVRAEAHEVGRFPDALVDLGARPAQEAERRGDVLVDRHGGVVDELLVDHGHAPGPARGGPSRPRCSRAPGPRGLVEPRHEAHQVVLPDSVGPRRTFIVPLWSRRRRG